MFTSSSFTADPNTCAPFWFVLCSSICFACSARFLADWLLFRNRLTRNRALQVQDVGMDASSTDVDLMLFDLSRANSHVLYQPDELFRARLLHMLNLCELPA